MFIWISPQLLNLLQSDLVWWCITMGQTVMQKDWFAVFKVKVTVRARKTQTTFFTISAELLIFFKPNLQPGVSCVQIGLLCSKTRSQWRIKASLNLYESDIFCTAGNQTKCGHGYMVSKLGNHTKCAGVLLLIIKPSTTKRAYTDSNTLSYSTTKPQGDKPCCRHSVITSLLWRSFFSAFKHKKRTPEPYAICIVQM